MVIIMPFAGNKTRPKLIDRHIITIIINTIFTLVFSFTVAFVIKSTYTYGPKTCRAKYGTGQRMAAYKIKYAVPNAPVNYPIQNSHAGTCQRPPFLVLRIGIGF